MQDRHIELLTAFIDGELTRREIGVLRLLNQSSEARSMLWQLQQNSLVFKQLPAKTLPADFSSTIVDIIVKTAAFPTPASAPAQPPQPAAPAAVWFGPKAAVRLAWAAGLLLAMGGGLFYFLRDTQTPQIVKNDPPSLHVPDPPDSRKIDPVVPKVTPKETPKPFDGQFVFADLKQRPQQELLEKELAKGKAVRVDLYVKNNLQALEKLGRKLQFQATPKKNKDKEHRLFVENLSPADVAGFLAELAREDKGIFRNMRVQPMSGEDQKFLCALLDIPPAELLTPTKLPNIIGANDKKDLPLPGPGKSQVPERRAVLLTREDANQIRNFVDQRRLRKPDTVQVLFVVHTSA